MIDTVTYMFLATVPIVPILRNSRKRKKSEKNSFRKHAFQNSLNEN
jgi:hypothetical protein